MSSKNSKRKISKTSFKDNINELNRIQYEAEEMLNKNPDKFWSSKISNEVKLRIIKEMIANIIIDCDNPDDFRIKVLREIAKDYQK